MLATPRIQIAVLVIFGQLIAAESVTAQNPLRQAQPTVASDSIPQQHTQPSDAHMLVPSPNSKGSQPQASSSEESAKPTNWLQAERMEAPQRADQQPAGHAAEDMNPQRSHPETFRADEYLRQASFDESLESNGESVAREIVLPGETNRLLGNSIFPNDQDLGEMISRITINSCFVLAIAVGCILLARQWFFRGTKSVGQSGDRAALCVKEILKIDSRITLRLIQWRSNDILVASDTTGIKSVSVLNAPFQEELDEKSESDLVHQIIKSISEKDSKSLKTS